jgi:hypothetical protein
MNDTLDTEEHRPPSRGEPPAGAECFVVAFPRAAAFPVPRTGEVLGRDWLTSHGIADRQISGAHARVSRERGALLIEDVGSRNGTWLHGVLLPRGRRTRLEDGAIVRLGDTILVYREWLRGELRPFPPIGALVGPFGLRDVTSLLDGLASRPPGNLLIEGATGTGKELLARAAAERFHRAKPYVAVNVAGVASGVFESQLFGYVGGSFSGAGRGADGIVVGARGGTVFLDEIGELPLELQPKLLRLLENREVLAVGAQRPTSADVLLIAATNRSLETMVKEGRFREDLLARFGSARVELPPLRERPEDIFPIIEAVLAREHRRLDPSRVEVEAVERMLLHPWRANVRELAGAVEAIGRVVAPPALPLWAVERVLGASGQVATGASALTAERVGATLAACAGNESEAARRLGVTRGRLRRFREGGR